MKWGKLTIAIFSFALFMSLQFFHFLNEKQSAVLLLILFSLKSQNKYFLFFSYIPCICFHLKRKILSLFNRKASGCSSADPIFFEKPEHPPPLLPCVKGLKTSAGCFYNFASNISYFKMIFCKIIVWYFLYGELLLVKNSFGATWACVARVSKHIFTIYTSPIIQTYFQNMSNNFSLSPWASIDVGLLGGNIFNNV